MDWIASETSTKSVRFNLLSPEIQEQQSHLRRHGLIPHPTRSHRPRVVPRHVIVSLTDENSRNIKAKLATLEILHKLFENRNNGLLWPQRRDDLEDFADKLTAVENSYHPLRPWIYFDNTSELRRVVEKERARISEDGSWRKVTGFNDKESKAAYKKIKEARRFWKSVSKVDEQCTNIRQKQMQTVRILRKFNPPRLDREMRQAIPCAKIRHKLQKRRPYRLADTGRIFPYKNIRLPATSGRIVRKLQKKRKAAYCSAP